MNQEDEILWVEKYRPKTVEECILPDRIKKSFVKFVKNSTFPNLLLSGGPGIGKTTIAKALCNDLGYEYILINASDERNIDTVRGKIKVYSEARSLEGNQKAIILDEADGLNPQSAQPALRAAIEEYSHMRFILTCNFKNKILSPIQSRTTTVDFNLLKEEKEDMMVEFTLRVFDILKAENIKFDKGSVVDIIKKYYPDNRRILNELQKYSIGGTIDSGILEAISISKVSELLDALKSKNLNDMRQWVANNADADVELLYSEIYETLYDSKLLDDDNILNMIQIIGDYQYKSAFAANQELNTMAMVATLMQLDFKR